MLSRAWAEAAAGGWVVVPGREGVEMDAEQALWWWLMLLWLMSS